MSRRTRTRSAGSMLLSAVVAAILASPIPVAGHGPLLVVAAPRQRSADLAPALRADGTFRGAPGVAGTVDTSAWSLVSDVASGEPPRFEPAAAGTANFRANLPAVLDDISPPPLIRDDTAAAYEALFAHIIAEVKPHGIVEHIWVRDFVDLAFEVVRLRGLKADLLTASAGEGLRTVLRDLDADDYFTLAKRWHARDPDAIATVEAVLAAAGLGLGVVRAQALAARLREVEAFDRMIRSAEAFAGAGFAVSLFSATGRFLMGFQAKRQDRVAV